MKQGPSSFKELLMKHTDTCIFPNNRSTVDDLWEMAANKIAPVLITCTQSVRRYVRCIVLCCFCMHGSMQVGLINKAPPINFIRYAPFLFSTVNKGVNKLWLARRLKV